jgi:MoxR-like ATPase
MEKLIIKPGEFIELPSVGDAPRQVHLFDAPTIHAVNAALAAKRPLLVRGEPGTGKTQLARAAAKAFGWAYIHSTIDSTSIASDLRYRVDSVTRLGEAQVMAALCTPAMSREEDREAMVREKLDEKRFIHPGPLWWAFDWESAKQQADLVNINAPPQPDDGDYQKGCVLLIDEIDKADADLPNGLLEAFGNGTFHPPSMEKPIFKGNRPLLVVITTNEERALPDAFLRRCLVLLLKIEEETLVEFLVERGKVHFGAIVDESILREAATQLETDRKDWKSRNLCAPGLAEYLDLIRAITGLAASTTEQKEVLKNIKRFILNKHPEGLN